MNQRYCEPLIGVVLKLPEVQGKLAADGAEPAHGAPEQFAAFIKSEMLRAATIVCDAGIRVD